MEQITSRDNRRIKEAAKLLRDRSFREETGLFLLEGLRICLDVARTTGLGETLFFTQKAADRFGADKILTSLAELPAPQGLPPEERMDLYRALDQLPEKYQDVVKLKYFDGYTIREISSATGMPEGTVSVYLRRAIQELRLRLKEEAVCEKK